jgi:antitoxin component of RelBE/YafQ-DinJ toxin-antitoxin module
VPRSSDAEKVQRLNSAFELLAAGYSLAAAADAVCERYGLSRRQAYRYLLEARDLKAPAAPVEATIPITIKVPAQTVQTLRAYSRSSGMTMGEIVSRAVSALLARTRRHG